MSYLSYFVLPLFISLLTMPYFIRKLTEKGWVVKDYHKPGDKKVPTGGGIIIILIALLSFSINSVFYQPPHLNFIILTIVALFGVFGIVDDMIDLRHVHKLVLPYIFSFPLFHYLSSTSIVLPFGEVNAGVLYPLLIIPIYVLVVSNMINMHSGYNGLSSGLSLILLFFLILKSYIAGSLPEILAILSIAGATLGFFYYEHYPSRMFWGNSGSLGVGAAVGLAIVTQGFLVSGFVMLLPHTFNFLLYVYWRARGLPKAKFGGVREDGTLVVPNKLTLKWILPYYFRLTEKQATYAMYALTAMFSFAGMWIPY